MRSSVHLASSTVRPRERSCSHATAVAHTCSAAPGTTPMRLRARSVLRRPQASSVPGRSGRSGSAASCTGSRRASPSSPPSAAFGLESTEVAELGIETREEGGVTVIALTGEFDLAGVHKFQAELAGVEADAPNVLLVDLGGLQFMDSSGLRALVMADHRAKAAGRRLAIVPGPPVVRRVFEITQLDDRLDLVENAAAL